MRYLKIYGWPNILYYSISIFIVLQSLIARAIFTGLAKMTSFKTETARVRFMTFSVFLIFFFNYGIMFLIAPINIDSEFMTTFFAGVYTDFSTHWFNQIGGLIVTSQLIVAVMPPITLFINWLIASMLYCYD